MDFSDFSLLFISFIFLSAITFLFFKGVAGGAGGSSTDGPSIIKPYPIIGNLPCLVKNRARFMDWVVELVSASPTRTVTVAPFVFTADPDAVEHIARSHFTSYHKGPSMTVTLFDLLGHGIFNANGETWRNQRTVASSEFTTRALRSTVNESVRHELDTRLIPLLARSARTGEVLDFQDVLQRFAFDNICNLVFNADPGCLADGEAASNDGDRFYRAYEDALHLSIQRWCYPFHWMWKLNRWLNVGTERRLRAALAAVRLYIETHMRRSRPPTSSNILSKFAETGAYSEEFIRDIIVNMLLAGGDSTPSALTWFFWTLSSAPEVTDKILAEIRCVRAMNGSKGALTADDLRGMHYLQAALTESMRLHPPVPMMPRECILDDVLPDGTKVRKGWTVMYSSYVMGRAKSLWGEGWAEFTPERWLEKGVFKPESSLKFPVFHAGPRLCLGKEMAYIQMKMLAAAVIERFEVEVVEGGGVPEIGVTLKMAGGLVVKVRERGRHEACQVWSNSEGWLS